MDRVDQSTLSQYEERERIKLAELRLEKKEQEPESKQAENAGLLLNQLQQAAAAAEEEEGEEPESLILTEGLTAEEVEQERLAEQAQKEAEQAQKEAEANARLERIVAKLLKTQTINEYLSILKKTDLPGSTQTMTSYLGKTNKFVESYFKRYKPYSFLLENFNADEWPLAMNYFIISFILSKLALIKKLPEDYRQQLIASFKTVKTMFSGTLDEILAKVIEKIKARPFYAKMIDNIAALNKSSKKF